MGSKTVFKRFGTLALAAAMAFCLAATPAFAETGAGIGGGASGEGNASIFVEDARKDATYKAYQILNLTEYDKAAGRYVYEIRTATGDGGAVTDMPVTTALRELIGEGKEFEVKRDDAGKVTGAGFEINKDGRHVSFWIPQAEIHSHTSACYNAENELICGRQDLNDAYAAWPEKDKNDFLTRFSTALREKIDVARLVPDKEVTATTVVEGGSEVTTASFDSLANGYWIVTSSAGSKSAVFTAIDNEAVISEKNEAPTLTKTVGDNDEGGDVTDNDVNVGDPVVYKVTIETHGGTENLVLEDTLSSGLTFDCIESILFNPKNGRLVYPNSNDEDDDGNRVTPAGEGIGLLDTPAVEITYPTADTNKLTIKFTEVFLKSLRTEITGESTEGGTGPMVAGDKRLEGKKFDKTNAAYYNVFLGDMSTMDDDGGTIIVTYKAWVNEKALVTNRAENSAKLEYGHNLGSLVKPDGTKTTTHTYDLVIDKYVNGDKSAKLANAEFNISCYRGIYINGEGSPLTYAVPDGSEEGAAKQLALNVAGLGTKKAVKIPLVEITDDEDFAEAFAAEKEAGSRIYRMATKDDASRVTTVVTGTNGKAIIKGLDSGLYSVHESKAPAGYNPLNEDPLVVLGSQSAGIGSDLFTKDEKSSSEVKTVFILDGDKMMDVANSSGVQMPLTGGIGTTIFYVVGVALVLGAGVLLILKKRTDRPGDES